MKEGNETESEEKGQETDEKFSAASYKDNMNVVLREDLKGVFEKFGTVKVLGIPCLMVVELYTFVKVCLRFYSCLL